VIRPGRDDRPTLAISERRARPKAERFDRPLRDGRVFLHHFPALRTGLLSRSPSGTSPQYNPRPLKTRMEDAHGQPPDESRERVALAQ
jgi:hypothetical protein